MNRQKAISYPFQLQSQELPVTRAAVSSRPLRVAVFLYRFPVPSETFVNTQIAGLVRRGVTVDVVSLKEEPGSQELADELGVREVRFQPPFPEGKAARVLTGFGVAAQVAAISPLVLLRSLNAFRWGRAAASLKLLYGASPFIGREYDIIHCHFGPAGLHAAMLREVGAIQGRITTVFHGVDVSAAIDRKGESVYDALFRFGDVFLPVSNQWRERLIEIGADPDRTQVHHMGVSLPDLSARRARTPGPVQFISVCRLVEKKGLQYAIRALAKLRDAGSWEYRILGDGPERKRLEQVIAESGLEGRVRLEGWRSPKEVSQALASADVFLAPSVTAKNGDQEGIPVGIMEAMAHSLPVVATDHTGIPELVNDGVTGFLAAEGDVEQLAQHLRTLLADADLRHRQGMAGRERVAAEYEVERLNDELLARFSELAAGATQQVRA